MKKKKRTSQYGTNKVKNFFVFITYHFWEFIMSLFFIGFIIAFLIIILSSEKINIGGKKGLNIQKKPIDITDTIQSTTRRRRK